MMGVSQKVLQILSLLMDKILFITAETLNYELWESPRRAAVRLKALQIWSAVCCQGHYLIVNH